MTRDPTSPAAVRVSVVIPIYNRAHLLERSLGSVLAQTMRDFEVLVIDDASFAPLDDAIAAFADPRVRLVRLPERSGVSAARNTGIELSRAPLIAFLDSDDAWQPNKLAAQVAFMNAHPHLPLVHTEEIWIRNGKRVNPKRYHQKSGGHIFRDALHRCLISPSAVVLRRSAFATFGRFDPTLPVCEDYDLWLRITSRSAVGFLSTPLTIKYGGHADQLSGALPAMDRFRVRALHKLLREVALSREDQVAAWTVMRDKSRVLWLGAEKRGLAEAAQYRQWFDAAVAALASLCSAS